MTAACSVTTPCSALGLTSAAMADVIFVSSLQRSQAPDFKTLVSAARQVLTRLSRLECAGLVALEFGNHPETAVARMRWCRSVVRPMS